MDELLETLSKKLGSAVLSVTKVGQRRLTVDLKAESLREAVETLKDNCEWLHFITITAIDKGLDMEFLHHFDIGGRIVTVRTTRPKEDNVLDSLADIVPASTYIEREIADLFGVELRGHPQNKPLLLPGDWPEDQHPLRKPLAGDLPKQTRPVVDSLITTGCVASVSTFMQRRREGAGLPATPTLVFSDEQSLRKYHEVIKDTGLDEKAGYSWERKKLRY